MACNYDESAEGDADCVFPAEFYDCDGCINDTDGDGVCVSSKSWVAQTLKLQLQHLRERGGWLVFVLGRLWSLRWR